MRNDGQDLGWTSDLPMPHIPPRLLFAPFPREGGLSFPTTSDRGRPLKRAYSPDTRKRSNSPKAPPSKRRNNGPPGGGVVDSIVPEKWPRDGNDYRVIQLSNGLKAVLIKEDLQQATLPPFHHARQMRAHGLRQFQSLSKKGQDFFELSNSRNFWCRVRKSVAPQFAGKYASVSLSVNVGYFHDPKDFHGMAHFTEHCVHYGSKKFPSEEAFGRLVSDFGLYSNAFTEENTTTYFYNIKKKKLPVSLDMFANMLLQPSFDVDVIRRELESLDNEFILKSQDYCNHQLLYQSLANDGHPFRNFGWGDKRTLNKSPSVTQQAMKKFHSEYYTPSAMTLCVTSNSELDELEALVVSCFGRYEGTSKRLIRRDSSIKSNHLDPFKESCNRIYVMQGCGNKYGLYLRWALPPEVWQDHKHKTLPVIISLLGDESENGLAQYLKTEGLILSAESDSCPCDNHWNDYNTLVDLRMVLTDKGEKQVTTILSACQIYISMLCNSPKEKLQTLFTQMKNSETRNFHFTGPGSALGLAYTAARNLQWHPPEKVLVGDAWTESEFNYEKLVSTMKLLSHSNLMAIKILKCGHEIKSGTLTETEKFSGVKYAKLQYDFGRLRRSPHLRFDLCTENQYVSGPLNPLNVEDHGVIESTCLDLQTYNCSGTKVTACHNGHRPNTVYKTEIHVDLVSTLYHISALSHCMTKLWVRCLNYYLMPLSCHAERLGYSSKIACGKDSVMLKVQGYPDKITEITQSLLNKWLEFTSIPENCFHMAKQAEMLSTDFIECGIMDALQVTRDIINYIDDTDNELLSDTTSILQDIKHEDLMQFISECKKTCYVLVEATGNVPISSIAAITQNINKLELSPTSHNPLLFPTGQQQPQTLPQGEKCIRLKSDCQASRCTMVTNIYEFGGFEPALYYMCSVVEARVEAFMCSQSFHHLRLKEQLGYFVNTLLSPPGFPISISVFVTATAAKHTPCELNEKIDGFMKDFEKYFDKISDSDYSEMLQQLHVPPLVSKDLVKQWMLSKFSSSAVPDLNAALRSDFKGIAKLSVQVLGLNAKPCDCVKCRAIDDWKPIRGKLRLAKVQGDGDQSTSYFVHDLSAFKKRL